MPADDHGTCEIANKKMHKFAQLSSARAHCGRSASRTGRSSKVRACANGPHTTVNRCGRHRSQDKANKCTQCGLCVNMCACGAILLHGRECRAHACCGYTREGESLTCGCTKHAREYTTPTHAFGCRRRAGWMAHTHTQTHSHSCTSARARTHRTTFYFSKRTAANASSRMRVRYTRGAYTSTSSDILRAFGSACERFWGFWHKANIELIYRERTW